MSFFSKIGNWLRDAAGSAIRTITGIPNLGNAIGPAIGAGAQYFLGQREQDQQNAQAEQQRLSNETLQREFAQNGLRWKVEDARRAGLHPLFALGGSGAAFQSQPITIGGGPDMAQVGQNIGRAASALMARDESATRAAALLAARASAEKDFAIASYYDAQSATLRQQASPAVPSALTNEWGVTSTPISMPSTLQGSLSYQADHDRLHPGSNRDPHIVNPNNPEPGFKLFQVRPGVQALLPNASSLGEALESVSESYATMAWVLAENVNRFGRGWIRQIGAGFPGLAGSVFSELDRAVSRRTSLNSQSLMDAFWQIAKRLPIGPNLLRK